jgi:hypothetical protein
VENVENADGSNYDCRFDVVFDGHSHSLSSFTDDDCPAVGVVVVEALAAALECSLGELIRHPVKQVDRLWIV